MTTRKLYHASKEMIQILYCLPGLYRNIDYGEKEYFIQVIANLLTSEVRRKIP